MFRGPGLILIAIVCMVVTGDFLEEKNKLILEIEALNNETDSKFKQLLEVKKEVETLNQKIENATAEMDLLTFNLTDSDKDVIILKATLKGLEISIKTKKPLLEHLKFDSLGAAFKAKLIKEEINFYQKRRDNGDEKTCFYITGITPSEASSSINDTKSRSKRSLPAKYDKIILETKLSKAKLELTSVEQDLLTENADLTARKNFYEQLKTTNQMLLDGLGEALLSNKAASEKLETEKKAMKIEDDRIHKELYKFKESITADIRTTKALETQLLVFKHAIECYDKLKS